MTLTTKLSTKGQVVLPQSTRRSRKWKPGTELIVEERPEGVLLRPVRPFPEATVEQAYGCLQYGGKAKTLAEMDEAIALGVKERRARGRY